MIAIASDHAGFEMKQEIMALLAEEGFACKDFGTYSKERCSYPYYGELAARAVAAGECERGILICGTGIGIGISANKVSGIRCAICSDCYSAKMSREHNDANMLSFGARVIGVGLAKEIVRTWLHAKFHGGRHQERIDSIAQIETRN